MNDEKNVMETIGIIVTGTALGVAIVIGISFVLAIPVWLLWNWLCPMIWGWPKLGLCQAWGLTLLCGFLFRVGTRQNRKE